VNCLTYVLRKGFAERKAGRRWGYLIIRRSQLAFDFGITNPWHPASWVPHFLHRDQFHCITQYLPTPEQRAINRQCGLLRAWLGLWSFEGEVCGDDNFLDYIRKGGNHA
jgi:hypothetical protein